MYLMTSTVAAVNAAEVRNSAGRFQPFWGGGSQKHTVSTTLQYRQDLQRECMRGLCPPARVPGRNPRTLSCRSALPAAVDADENPDQRAQDGHETQLLEIEAGERPELVGPAGLIGQ